MRPRSITYMIGTAARALPFDNESETLRIAEVLSAPCSAWQNPYVERLIASTRRVYLAHIMVLSEWHLKRILSRDFDDDHPCRPHLSRDMDCPEARPIQPPASVYAVPEVWGVHHRDGREAA
jgi:putative transposase